MLLYAKSNGIGLPTNLDYQASVRLKNGRPMFKGLWVSPSLVKHLANYRSKFNIGDLQPKLHFWPYEQVALQDSKFLFNLPKKIRPVR